MKTIDYKYETYNIFHYNIDLSYKHGKNRRMFGNIELYKSVRKMTSNVSSITTSKNIFEYEKHNVKR